jgi:hypothetical protein
LTLCAQTRRNLIKRRDGFTRFSVFGTRGYGFDDGLGIILRLPCVKKAEVDLFDPWLLTEQESTLGRVTTAEGLEKGEG